MSMVSRRPILVIEVGPLFELSPHIRCPVPDMSFGRQPVLVDGHLTKSDTVPYSVALLVSHMCSSVW